MKTVRDLLGDQARTFASISADANVFAALTLMSEKRLGSLVVMDKKNLVGTLHERDCLEKILLWGQRSRETKVREVMRENPITVRLDDSFETCILYLLTEQATQLPVLDKTNVVGVISSEDILRIQLKRPGVVPPRPVSVAAASKVTSNSKPNERVWAGRVLN